MKTEKREHVKGRSTGWAGRDEKGSVCQVGVSVGSRR